MGIVAENDALRIERLVLGPFGTNAYVVTCRKTGDSVVIDAPGDLAQILETLQPSHPKYILVTHNHADHTGVLSELKSALKVPIASHAADGNGLPVPPDVLLEDGDIVSFGQVGLQVLHTPGHTPGSLCFLADRYLLAGDTIFPGGPGKTWSPADFKRILESLTSKIFKLPDETTVYPGHGDATTLGTERAAFEAFRSRPHDPTLCGDVLWSSA